MDTPIGEHLTLRDKIYILLRKSILKRELPPGSRITEIELAKKFGISRTPIREAFRKLESDGFIAIYPRKGAVVTKIDQESVIEFYQVKGILESHAGKLALKYITPDDIKKLEELNEKLRELAKLKNTPNFNEDEFNKTHNEFHNKFISICKNNLLIEIIRNLVRKYLRFRLMVEHTDYIDKIISEHEDIIKAFKQKDEKKVEEAIKKNAELGIFLIKKFYLEG